MREWTVDRTRRLWRHRILELQERRLAAGEERRDVLVMDAPDWINVIPVLHDERVVMVRQWRYGVQAPTLEIPGGMVDPGEGSREAAARELLEETGYRAGSLRRLGYTHPNPAFITNQLTTWLATDLEKVSSDREVFGVEGEEIFCELVPLADVPGLIRGAEITHALVVAAFHLLGLDAEWAKRATTVPAGGTE
jgi:8-oxo-dGTP pyrophosphatase MutT (NUDIX family)